MEEMRKLEARLKTGAWSLNPAAMGSHRGTNKQMTVWSGEAKRLNVTDHLS